MKNGSEVETLATAGATCTCAVAQRRGGRAGAARCAAHSGAAADAAAPKAKARLDEEVEDGTEQIQGDLVEGDLIEGG